MKNIKSTKGFTLIEALIVVIIVGLLAGVGIVKLGTAKDDATLAVSRSAAAEINKGLQRAIVAADGTGYVTATVSAAAITAGGVTLTDAVIDALVAEGHFTTASAVSMKAALLKRPISITMGAGGVAQAGPCNLKVFAGTGQYEASL